MNILFLCVANSARSQLAEGLAKKIFGPGVKIESAGSVPSGKVNPFAISVLKEMEIDISKNQSKSIDDLNPEFIVGLNYVITLCAEEVCPVMVSKAKKLHWGLPDPAAVRGSDLEVLQAFRNTRDEIQRRLIEFKSQIE
jgi:arsenate reductase